MLKQLSFISYFIFILITTVFIGLSPPATAQLREPSLWPEDGLTATTAAQSAAQNKSPPVDSGSAAPDNIRESGEALPENEQSTENRPDGRITVLAVGDNLIHDVIYEQAAERGAGSYNFLPAYRRAEPIISSADISIINQETLIHPSRKPQTYPLFCSPPELIYNLEAIGFDVFSLANNHLFDMGATGLLESFKFWRGSGRAFSGLYPARPQSSGEGVGGQGGGSHLIPVIEREGIRVAVVSFTEFANLPEPEGALCRTVFTHNPEDMRDVVLRAKQVSDIVIATVHWGEEYSSSPTRAQRLTAERLAALGVGAIFGSHPHVLQNFETLPSPTGEEVPVFYSLGNFISAQDKPLTMLGGAANITVTKAGGKATAEFESFIPLVTHYNRGMRDVSVYPFSDYTELLAASHGIKSKAPQFSKEYLARYLKSVGLG